MTTWYTTVVAAGALYNDLTGTPGYGQPEWGSAELYGKTTLEDAIELAGRCYTSSGYGMTQIGDPVQMSPTCPSEDPFVTGTWSPSWPIYKVPIDLTPGIGNTYLLVFGFVVEDGIYPDSFGAVFTYPQWSGENGDDVCDTALGQSFFGFVYGPIFPEVECCFQLAIRPPYGRWISKEGDTNAPNKYKYGVSTVTFCFADGTRYGQVRPAKDGGFMLYETATEGGTPIGFARVYRQDRTLVTIVPANQIFVYAA
jgi:hypothetical protein